MTKKEMIDFIEKSHQFLNFKRSYFNSMLKEDVERHYNDAKAFVEREVK